MSVSIPVASVARHCNPFRGTPWGERITKADVRRALESGRLEPKQGTGDHAARIAYLVMNPSDDPIEVDVGVPVLGFYMGWMVTDGNHRLAAAIYRGDDAIECGVSGQLDYAEKLFGVDCTETEATLEKACKLRERSCA